MVAFEKVTMWPLIAAMLIIGIYPTPLVEYFNRVCARTAGLRAKPRLISEWRTTGGRPRSNRTRNHTSDRRPVHLLPGPGLRSRRRQEIRSQLHGAGRPLPERCPCGRRAAAEYLRDRRIRRTEARYQDRLLDDDHRQLRQLHQGHGFRRHDPDRHRGRPLHEPPLRQPGRILDLLPHGEPGDEHRRQRQQPGPGLSRHRVPVDHQLHAGRFPAR